MERYSSDEEDDRRTLVPQNETKPENPRSALHIDDFEPPRFGPRRNLKLNFNFNRRYLFAIFLPLVVIVLFFSADIRNLFSTSFSVRFDSAADRMRESELRALGLLRRQQLGLLALWNSTGSGFSVNSSVDYLNSSSGSGKQNQIWASFDDIKSAVLQQISLNKEIQRVLLLPHQVGNLSSEVGSDDFSGVPGLGFGRCRKMDQKLSERRTIEWKPREDKFLFAICVSGQMSNHLICLEKHMFFAALLNRVLVIPSYKVDYQFNRVLDIEHINKCLGRKVVVTFEEFAEIKRNHLHIDRFICYFSSPAHCYVDDDHVKKLKSQLGISMGKLESPWTEDVKKPSKKTVQDIEAKFSTNDDVIAIGDVFFSDLETEWVMQPSGPLAHQCKTLIEPSRLIMLTAQRFIQTFLGKNFIALHFRRHGFLKFCNAKTPSCFFPVPQAAECISRVVEKVNAPVIYLSTDAAESETGLMQSLIVVNGKTVPLVKRPPRNLAEKWDALLYRHGLEENSQVEAMLDKSICAMASVFIGASGSTFTEDILRLRKDWGSASVCDEYLCQGEVPNFIAEDV